MKLPMKFRVLSLAAQHEIISDQEVFALLQKEYGEERQCNKSIIGNHLYSMRANCLLEDGEPQIDSEGNLVQFFRITDLGKQRLSLLPKDSFNFI